ncbi:hypothetical protein FQA39_LY00332 [Lamprigera yunnana]|nr:hypothetical protein FQA39_LY00332 [Lamprigera yunnana]
MSDKRPHSANFSPEEKLYCLNIIKKYKHIIESKETDGGPPSSSSAMTCTNDATYELTLDFINKKTVFRLINKFVSDLDTDFINFNQSGDEKIDENNEIIDNTEETFIIQMSTEDDNESNSLKESASAAPQID